MTPTEVAARIQEAIGAAKGPDTQLVCEATASPETENITTELTVRFAPGRPNGGIDLARLIQQLGGDASMGSITLSGPPENRLVLHGSFETKLFKIAFVLGAPSTATQ